MNIKIDEKFQEIRNTVWDFSANCFSIYGRRFNWNGNYAVFNCYGELFVINCNYSEIINRSFGAKVLKCYLRLMIKY